MNKKNYDELTKKLNEFRMTNLKKSYTSEELHAALKPLGFARTISSIIAQKCFPYETINGKRLYGIPKDPIHKNIIINAYAHVNNYNRKIRNKPLIKEKNISVGVDMFLQKMEEQKIAEYSRFLIERGFKVQRPLGLDTKQLLKDHPELAKTYMRYENIK